MANRYFFKLVGRLALNLHTLIRTFATCYEWPYLFSDFFLAFGTLLFIGADWNRIIILERKKQLMIPSAMCIKCSEQLRMYLDSLDFLRDFLDYKGVSMRMTQPVYTNEVLQLRWWLVRTLHLFCLSRPSSPRSTERNSVFNQTTLFHMGWKMNVRAYYHHFAPWMVCTMIYIKRLAQTSGHLLSSTHLRQEIWKC